jgi:hypothetical protein
MTMFTKGFDLDVTLRDASLDPENRPTRRMIASATLGVGIEDAYYSVREIREAVEWIHQGEPRGKAKLASLLANPGDDDYQRCIYFCLAGRGVVEMLDDLMWLEDLLESRARVAGELHAKKVLYRPMVNPYVAPEPDGPLVDGRSDFTQGRSWWGDPTLS